MKVLGECQVRKNQKLTVDMLLLVFKQNFSNAQLLKHAITRIIHKPGQFVKKHHTKAIFRLMHPENMKRHNDNRILSDLLNKQTKNQLKRVDESPGLCFFI